MNTAEGARNVVNRWPILLLLTVTVSVVISLLVLVANVRFTPLPGTVLSSDGRLLRSLLRGALGASILSNLLFGHSLIALRRGVGSNRAIWPALGTIAACIPLPLLVYFGAGYIDCFSSCNPPAPSQFLWPAFLLSLACVPLGILSTVTMSFRSRASRRRRRFWSAWR
jgi:hypothetical protein